VVSEAAIRKRFLQLLRMAHPRRGDTVVAVTLNNPQSYLLLKLLLGIEQEYDSRVVNLHLGNTLPTALRELCGACDLQIQLKTTPASVTQLKLLVAGALAAFRDPLCVLPLTAEEVASYVLGELLAGNLAGLVLDRMYRTAYPLSTTSLRDVTAGSDFPLDSASSLIAPGVATLIQSLAGRVDLPALSKLYLRFVYSMAERAAGTPEGEKEI